MLDFTNQSYLRLLRSFLNARFTFQPFRDYLQKPGARTVIFRHDIDAREQNAMRCAQIEHELGICATYFFRIVPQSYDAGIVRQIASLGHEIGYHYEDMALAKGDPLKAIGLFQQHLAILRELYPVETICMHGSPLSRWDSRKLWEKYNYSDFGIIGEPYFDIDFTKVLYLTDTGRRWNGEKYSVRDKVGKKAEVKEGKKLLSAKYNFRSTFDIISAAERGELPDKIMINMHPQRWNDKPLPWIKEYVMQNVKNVVKRVFFVK